MTFDKAPNQTNKAMVVDAENAGTAVALNPWESQARAQVECVKRQIRAEARGPLDLLTLPNRTLAPLDFVLGRLGLMTHTTGIEYAPGGTGKGFFTLALASSVACEVKDIPFFGLPQFPPPQERGRVVILMAEDPQEVLEHRMQPILQSIATLYGEQPAASIAANLHVESLHGMAPCLVGKGGDTSTPQCTAWTEYIMELVRGARLFVLDTMSCFHRANENDNGEMHTLMQVCNRIAMETNGAGILLHHTPRDAPGQARGAGAIINSARWACGLQQDAKDRCKVAVRVTKENNIEPVDEFFLRRGERGILGAQTGGKPTATHGHGFCIAP